MSHSLGNICIRPTVEADLEHAKGRFREEDIDACIRIIEQSPETSLELLMKRGHKIYTFITPTQILGFVGLINAGKEGIYTLVFLCTRDVQSHWLSMGKYCRKTFNLNRPKVREVFQYVPLDHHGDRRFAKFVGFKEQEVCTILNGVECVRIALNDLPYTIDPQCPFDV